MENEVESEVLFPQFLSMDFNEQSAGFEHLAVACKPVCDLSMLETGHGIDKRSFSYPYFMM